MKNNNRLLEIYKDKNKDSVWNKNFSSLAAGKKGRVLKYLNTNFRTQMAFIRQFTKFEERENIERENWPQQKNHGQEQDKQRVVKMLESRLFKREKKDKKQEVIGKHNFLYNKTKKGNSYRKYISMKFSENESWIINYLYLLNGNYNNEKNHIVETTKEILKIFRLLNIEENKISLLFQEALHISNVSELIKKDIFYIMSFYGDIEFLEIYFKSNKVEKEVLHKYIIKNIKEKNNLCCISKKYKLGGNYSYRMVIDEIKVLYITAQLLKIKSNDIQSVFNNILLKYKNQFNYDKKIVSKYLYEQTDIFQPILLEALEIEEETIETDDTKEEVENSPLPYIDTTTKQGQAKANHVFSSKKKKARELAEFKCSLERKRNCNNHYFTSKATEKNYIEIHHLIPKEYSNRFKYSIEVFPNYVTLCPSCHQLLHKAVDRERKDHLTELLNERKEKLSALNLDIEIEELVEFYGIKI